MYYVYIIKSKRDNRTYVGYTNDLKRRFLEHNKNESISTRNKGPWELIYYEAYKSKSDAKYREYNLKRFAKAYVQLKKRMKGSLE